MNNHDPLAKFLSATGPCPTNVFELRSRLTSGGAKLRPAFVANRGFHNPKNNADKVQMMLFEIISGRLSQPVIEIKDGEFFFGHFITTDGTNFKAGQDVFIELLAWDPVKEVFNFYELTDDRGGPKWFYRGDSIDIQNDVRLLHRQPDPNRPQFGKQLRCSGCHTAGGPIMKELAAPHNDWWTKARPLPLDKPRPDAQLASVLKELVDAEELATSVKAGLDKMAASAKFLQAKQALTLQEQLRPLFCEVELNLESDPAPLDDKREQINIPSAFFVNPLLARGSVSVRRAHYDAALAEAKSSFPETSRADADHGWLTPVKAFSDALAIDSLVKQGLIDPEFVSDVLAIDLTTPLFSTRRCKLLRLLPDSAAGDWQTTFRDSLKTAAIGDTAAQELLINLTDPRRDAKFHQMRAARLLDQCQNRAQSKEAVVEFYHLLAQRRQEVRDSEISKNPQGQILEPKFRVIFPTTTLTIRSGSLRLTEDGLVIRQ
jgi:hypothetical protein